jgi:hypothetical protein
LGKRLLKVSSVASSKAVEPEQELPYGLKVGQKLKYQRVPNAQKSYVTVRGIENDGSVSCFDERGAFRAIRPELLEVSRETKRGKLEWVKLI